MRGLTGLFIFALAALQGTDARSRHRRSHNNKRATCPGRSHPPAAASSAITVPLIGGIAPSVVSGVSSIVSAVIKHTPTPAPKPTQAPEPAPAPEPEAPAPKPEPTESTSTSNERPVASKPVSKNPPPSPPPPSSNTGSSGSSSSDPQIQAYLNSHNTVRAAHDAGPLSWNGTLEAAAQVWANKCVFEHSGGQLGPFGENLAAGTGGMTIEQGVKDWADEAPQYNPGSPVPSHFTQMVWKSSTQVGCAVSSCNGIFDSSFGPANFYVCEYFPQGNVIGAFAQNVLGF